MPAAYSPSRVVALAVTSSTAEDAARRRRDSEKCPLRRGCNFRVPSRPYIRTGIAGSHASGTNPGNALSPPSRRPRLFSSLTLQHSPIYNIFRHRRYSIWDGNVSKAANGAIINHIRHEHRQSALYPAPQSHSVLEVPRFHSNLMLLTRTRSSNGNTRQAPNCNSVSGERPR